MSFGRNIQNTLKYFLRHNSNVYSYKDVLF